MIKNWNEINLIGRTDKEDESKYNGFVWPNLIFNLLFFTSVLAALNIIK